MEQLLQRLETKIRDLIEKNDQGKMSLAQENEALLLKQQKAVEQIKGLITRLKSIGKIA